MEVNNAELILAAGMPVDCIIKERRKAWERKLGQVTYINVNVKECDNFHGRQESRLRGLKGG